MSVEAEDTSSFVSFWASEALLDLSRDIRSRLPAAEDDDSWRTAISVLVEKERMRDRIRSNKVTGEDSKKWQWK